MQKTRSVRFSRFDVTDLQTDTHTHTHRDGVGGASMA